MVFFYSFYLAFNNYTPTTFVTVAVALAIFIAPLFTLLIIPAPPAETIESAILGVIKTPIPVTMKATQGNSTV